jgi:hypothetical protein
MSNFPPNTKSWINDIIPPDCLLSSINLPGSHDSAAINRFISTPYACQISSITEQLEQGVRVLDIRKSKRNK